MSASDAIWFLHDGAAGNRRQAEALAQALLARRPDAANNAAREWALQLAAPWSWLAPRRLPGAATAFGEPFAAALASPPALAIGCGRRAALATRLVRARGARAVQILDPRMRTDAWDLVIAPEHDGLQASNVLTLCGSLNPVDDAWLAAARDAHAALLRLPSPRIVVLVGAPTPAVRFGDADVAALVAAIDREAAAAGGSVLVLGSRRTSPALAGMLRAGGSAPGLRWFGEHDGPNPYAGALAVADRLVCTPDSVNMLSEACATRTPVGVFSPDVATGRIRRFIDGLVARGRIDAYVPGAGFTAAAGPVEPLRETARIAALVEERLRAPAG